MKRKFLPFILIAVLGLTNCKKDKSTSTEILVSKTWKKALNDKNTATNPTGTVIYSSVQNCELDDTFNFGTDGKLLVNNGSVKCEQNETQNTTQTYSLKRTTKEFTINGTKYVLAEESSSQIKYYTAIPSGTGFQYLIFLLQ
jgi:hypothetical protein